MVSIQEPGSWSSVQYYGVKEFDEAYGCYSIEMKILQSVVWDKGDFIWFNSDTNQFFDLDEVMEE